LRPAVLFVTDPLCSWCWGTLPEIEATRRALDREVDFDLIMAGLQIGRPDGLAEYNVRQLRKLWREVRQVTGQVFSERLPDGFVYHSEVACRAVEIARHEAGGPPWVFLGRLQRAFYVDGRDINDPQVLAQLLELPLASVQSALRDRAFVDAARANFELAKSLSANALPNILIDTGEGYRLLCGGYVTAEYLVPDIRARL